MNFNVMDAVFLIVVLVSILLGVIKGFVRELFSLAFLILSVILAFLFYHDVGSWLLGSLKDREVANFVAFILIFIVFLIVGSVITYLVKKLVVIGPLKSVDRILGGTFGLVRGILISAVIIFGLVSFSIKKDLVAESTFSPFILKSVKVFVQLLPKNFKDKLKDFSHHVREKSIRACRAV